MTTYPNSEFNIKIEAQKYKQEGDLAYKYAPFKNLQVSEDDPIKNLKKGQLIDLSTTDLNFKLSHPVDIQVQPSYDGTVNLILNDDINPPRIVNSRFTVTEDKRFKIIDRNGDNDTNIYSTNTFDLETRLFRNSNHIPFIDFLGLQEGGSLKSGTY